MDVSRATNNSLVVTRRQVLGLGLTGAGIAGLTLAGCAGRLWSPEFTIESLLADRPLYIAHRGSGDNWTEHTMKAYSESVASGVKALEISVNATADGILLCHHDPTLTRMAGVDTTISRVAYKSIAGIQLNARAWLGADTPLEPLAKLSDVLDRFAASHVIFIEDKQGTNTQALLELMDSYPRSTSHFVWKQPATARSGAEIATHGYKIWGYFSLDETALFPELAPTLDFLGLYFTAPDAATRSLVDYGKPVIAWEVHTRSVRDHLLALGVQGMMCSNIPYVTSSGQRSTKDSFATGMRAAGDLPWVQDKGWGVQPVLDSTTATAQIATPVNCSYQMGSLAPISADTFSITVELRWPERLPPDSASAGVAFGQSSDAPYRVHIPSDVGGYHLILRPNGELVLFIRDPGDTDGRRLVSVMTAPVTMGEWVTMKIDVGPAEIQISRDGVPGWLVATQEATYRGRYFSLCKNYVGAVPVEFRAVGVS